MNGIKVDC